jgi:ribonuclease HI
MEIIIFTDGSVMNNPNKNCNNKKIGGYSCYFPNNEIKSYGKKLIYKPITNQRAELMGIYSSLKKCNEYIKNNINTINKIKIFSDSYYGINSVSVWYKKWIKNNWMRPYNQVVSNQDIIKKILIIINEINKNNVVIIFQHVKAHTKNNDFNSISNNIADKLAKKAALSNIN